MEFEKIKNKGQGRLFKTEYLEQMTKTHPIVIFSLYVPIIIFLLYFGYNYREVKGLSLFALFVIGALSWSLFEYLMHRHLFHMVVDSPRSRKIVYTMHGVHHEFPRDKERLFMPPIPSIILASLLFCLFSLIMGRYTFGFFPGFMFGYLMYGSMHYAIHAFAPPKYLKALWRNHHLHHYKHPDKGYGVSSVLWDVIFRTVPKKEAA